MKINQRQASDLHETEINGFDKEDILAQEFNKSL